MELELNRFPFDPIALSQAADATNHVDSVFIRKLMASINSNQNLSNLNIADKLPSLLTLYESSKETPLEKDALHLIQSAFDVLSSQLSNQTTNMTRMIQFCDNFAKEIDDQKSEKLIEKRNEIANEASFGIKKPKFISPAHKQQRHFENAPVVESNPISVKHSISELKKKYESGDSEGTYLLGLSLFNGDGIKQDSAKGLELIKTAADCDLPEAQAKYGYILLKGINGEKDVNTGLKYIKLAADAEDPDGLFQYASAPYFGIGIKANKTKAAEYYRRSADAGDPRAQLKYAMKLKEGEDVPQNLTKAIWYFCLAAQYGSKDAIDELEKLGVLYNQ
ncbi:hypothetical protein TRFO_16667 [Tritrichomonas foetus]|uniref:Sel1 repeat family protein n=1 Tax=Tritrichomonas foetus TaxID=1144522 RepID=A0A1J4KUQ7_9EUKA|nr:hypothetical protein TRFO_16667 [Tritrichomonas foetus]|eukprot:OHT13229.1 hypothetical protein TRFO_16667 [Tritrichomonas foetus]